jgi:RNA polymerase sigma-70 factor, ECF subfamily
MGSITRPILPSTAVRRLLPMLATCGVRHEERDMLVIDYWFEPRGRLVARSGNSHGNRRHFSITGRGRRRTPSRRARRADRLAREVIGWPAGHVAPAMAAAGNEAVSEPETVAAAVDPGWEVLARVAAGDADAFAILVEAHQERLLRLCERMLGDAEEARDAAQDVFLKAYRKAADFRPRGQVYTWLYRIATNLCLNKLRRRRVVRFVQWEDPEEREAAPFDPPDGAPGAEAALEARRRWRQTRKVIARLPAGQRAVLVLARFEGLSYRQIAEVLGITEGAVESRLFRAMRRIEETAAQD